VRETSAIGTLHAEAVLATGKYFFLFDFSHSRYQKWPLPAGNATQPEGNAKPSCAIIDTLQGNWSHPSRWLALPAATQPFQPIQAISGPNGSFFLLDRASKRLALYDTNAQFVSSIPLPQEIRNRNLNKIEIYWTRDGLFSFLDLHEAKVWKYSELRSSGGSGAWQLRFTLNLPLGINACLWEPYFKHPVCLRKGSGPMIFDDYFNLAHSKLSSPAGVGILAMPEPEGTGWRIYVPPNATCPTSTSYYFSASSSGFSADPEFLSPNPGLTPLKP
jgi:hypothetical protein